MLNIEIESLPQNLSNQIRFAFDAKELFNTNRVAQSSCKTTESMPPWAQKIAVRLK